MESISSLPSPNGTLSSGPDVSEETNQQTNPFGDHMKTLLGNIFDRLPQKCEGRRESAKYNYLQWTGQLEWELTTSWYAYAFKGKSVLWREKAIRLMRKKENLNKIIENISLNHHHVPIISDFFVGYADFVAVQRNYHLGYLDKDVLRFLFKSLETPLIKLEDPDPTNPTPCLHGDEIMSLLAARSTAEAPSNGVVKLYFTPENDRLNAENGVAPLPLNAPRPSTGSLLIWMNSWEFDIYQKIGALASHVSVRHKVAFDTNWNWGTADLSAVEKRTAEMLPDANAPEILARLNIPSSGHVKARALHLNVLLGVSHETNLDDISTFVSWVLGTCGLQKSATATTPARPLVGSSAFNASRQTPVTTQPHPKSGSSSPPRKPARHMRVIPLSPKLNELARQAKEGFLRLIQPRGSASNSVETTPVAEENAQAGPSGAATHKLGDSDSQDPDNQNPEDGGTVVAAVPSIPLPSAVQGVGLGLSQLGVPSSGSSIESPSSQPSQPRSPGSPSTEGSGQPQSAGSSTTSQEATSALNTEARHIQGNNNPNHLARISSHRLELQTIISTMEGMLAEGHQTLRRALVQLFDAMTTTVQGWDTTDERGNLSAPSTPGPSTALQTRTSAAPDPTSQAAEEVVERERKRKPSDEPEPGPLSPTGSESRRPSKLVKVTEEQAEPNASPPTHSTSPSFLANLAAAAASKLKRWEKGKTVGSCSPSE